MIDAHTKEQINHLQQILDRRRRIVEFLQAKEEIPVPVDLERTLSEIREQARYELAAERPNQFKEVMRNIAGRELADMISSLKEFHEAMEAP